MILKKEKAIAQIKAKVEFLADKIKVPRNLLPVFDGPLKSPGIEIDDLGNFYYVTLGDRGPVERHICLDEDDLLFRIFYSITSAMAMDQVIAMTVGADFRTVWFSKQEDHLGQLNKQWEKRAIAEHTRTLKHFPKK